MITQARLKSLFIYDEETGDLIWRERPRSDFATDMAWRTINSRQAGKVAGYKAPEGYVYIGIDGRIYRAHRLVWLYVHGELPDEIDHEDGIRSNNRLRNLRKADRHEQGQNIKLPADNTSGHVGVSWFKRRQKWQAYINSRGKRENLGYFDTAEAAAAAYLAAKQRLHTFNPVPRYLDGAA